MQAFILAGGESKRINFDKGLLEINNKRLIEVIIEKLKECFKEITIIGNKNIYSYLNIKIVEDLVENKGPLGGIYTGLKISTTKYNFFCACDMPFINTELINYMQSQVYQFDAVIPKMGNFLEPLFAIYSKRCLPFIERNLKNNELKISNFFQEINTNYINVNHFNYRTIFFNINTLQDLEIANKIWLK